MGLNEFLTTGVFAFMLTFVRIGTAATIMPSIGDSFVPPRLRLLISLGLTLVLFPLVFPNLPNPVPGPLGLSVLMAMEFITGLLIGTVARILMSALDTAGMVISTTSGLGNAQLFNPAFATQGSLIGSFLTTTGVLVFFAANMHHLLFYALVGSYELFPVGGIVDTGGMAEMISRAVNAAFLIGVQLASPFLVISMMIYIGMGVLSRLMPQVQVFLLALPIQIVVSLTTISFVLSAMFLFWLERFEAGMVFFLSN